MFLATGSTSNRKMEKVVYANLQRFWNSNWSLCRTKSVESLSFQGAWHFDGLIAVHWSINKWFAADQNACQIKTDSDRQQLQYMEYVALLKLAMKQLLERELAR